MNNRIRIATVLLIASAITVWGLRVNNVRVDETLEVDNILPVPPTGASVDTTFTAQSTSVGAWYAHPRPFF